jgi:hypothetical protein
MQKQITDKTAIEKKIITYYETLICKAIANIISLLDHLVHCKIFLIVLNIYQVSLLIEENKFVSNDLTTLLIKFKPTLRMVRFDDGLVLNVDLSGKLEFLNTDSENFFQANSLLHWLNCI